MKKKEKMKRLMVAVGDVFSTFLVTALTAAVLGNWLVASGSLLVGVLGLAILQITGKLSLQDPATQKKLLVIAGIICSLFLPAAFIAALVWHWVIAAECIVVGVIGLGILYVMPTGNTSLKSGHKQA